MSGDLAFACECGAVTGQIHDADPSVGDHVVCHCTDCQRFATRFRAGDRIMDRYGGTALYQSRCARVTIDSGKDRLASIHLTDKPTLRWYAACCDTPMFNSYRNGRVPYITTLLGNCDGAAVSTALGPPIGHLFMADAPTPPPGVPELSMARLMRRFMGRMVRDIISGDRRRSPLFHPDTLAPVAEPQHAGAVNE